ncbi:DJ-1 family glyoxalase III [Sphaerochaeta sp. PS]|uniref:DJ-1 family glyoxalase III n=1 Tax=Sphaerochaeta sp. PS TaxID=3076336 RepID=UPI0028A46A0B|nr:DJ-1 family glyoxalase III [Sphaerochaeta sp. PS]MDT4762822.1 DJ-1/PfpI family protein [Sphaerochaeta sp. PS]
MVPSVLVILAEGFEEIEAITPIDLIRRSGAKVTVAGLGSLTVHGSHGIGVVCDKLFSDCLDEYDCVVLPGGSEGARNLASSFAVLELCIRTSQKGTVAAICAAPALVLGKTGLLDGKRVTGFPGTEIEGLSLQDSKVITDGFLITAQAAGSAVDFSLAIIAKLFDAKTAEKIAAQIRF